MVRIMSIFFLALFTAMASLAAGKIIEVCPSCPVSSLQGAIEAAAPYDTILVRKGTYPIHRTLMISKPLVIRGESYPVLDGQGQRGIMEIYADSVRIEGLVLQHVGKSYVEDRAAILIEGVSGFVVSNNRINDSFFGVLCKKSAGGSIKGNRISGRAENEFSSGNAIHLWYCKNIEVLHNQLKGHRDGIYLEFVDSSEVTGNTSEGNLRYGLHFMFSNHDTYRENIFRQNGAGVAVMFSRHINMFGNHFLDNWGASSYGLLLKEIYDGKVSGNHFRRNTVAIHAEGAVRLHFEQNQIESNGWGLRIMGSSMDNVFTGNDFIANTFNVATNASQGKNSYYANYWSDYRGYDLDRDGRGDVPHRPVSLFAYLADRIDASLVLMRSNAILLVDMVERVLPAVTPLDLVDDTPLMKPYFK